MKKRMYWSMCVASVVMVLLTAGLTLWLVYGLLLHQARLELADGYKLVSQSIHYLGEQKASDYLESLGLRFDSLRITLISTEGQVIFDTDNDSSFMENHTQRPEVQAALRGRMGTDIRHSKTMGMDTYYLAGKLDEHTILRVSKQTRSIGSVFVSVIPLMLAIIICAFIGCSLLASRVTKKLLQPVEKLAAEIDHPVLAGQVYYEELDPFFRKIREQNQQIQEQISHLRQERDTIRLITSNMQEGLVLLDEQRNILSLNHSAITLLEAPSADYLGKNIIALSRNYELSQGIDRAMAGENVTLLIERERDACRLFINPVHYHGKVCGSIILILDVTESLRAEKIRREFTANVSHELKTPLTSISGFAELIQNGMVQAPEDVCQFAGRIYKEASRLITLTDDIIRLARIEEGAKIEMESIELRTLCDGVVGALQFSAEQKQVQLSVSGDSVHMIGNYRMLEELVYNLTENAIKYNRPDGRVDLSIEHDGAQAILRVADTGIGIPREHQDRIFERFYRVDASRSKQTGGTGLGLSIVKHIVERMGGTVQLESQPDVGTTVTVYFSLSQP